MARITLWGFYTWGDKTLFDNIVLPESFDKQTLVDLILSMSGDLYPYYQQPQYLQANIENWFRRKYEDFLRMWDALYSDYDPIENYNRFENWSDSASESTSESTSESASSSANNSDASSNSMLNDVSAYDVSNYSPESKATTAATAETKNNTQFNRKHEHNDFRDSYSEHGGRIHGNIGVMTTQQMIESELKLREYDIYQRIAEMFEEQFITRVY